MNERATLAPHKFDQELPIKTYEVDLKITTRLGHAIREVSKVGGDRLIVITDELRKAGRELFGERWQTVMARHLRVDPSTVRRWLAGKVEIPGPAEVALELLLEKKRQK